MRRVLALLLVAASAGCSLLLGEGLSGGDDASGSPIGSDARPSDGTGSGDAAGSPRPGGEQDACPPDGCAPPLPPCDGPCAPTTIETVEILTDVAADETGVYWLDAKSGDVRAAKVDGTAARTIVATGAAPARLALDSAFVYWTESGQGRVRAADKGATRTNPAVELTGLAYPRYIAVSGGDVYFHHDQSGVVTRTGSALTAPAPVTTIAPANQGVGTVAGLCADGNHVFVSVSGSSINVVKRYPRGGGAPFDVTGKTQDLRRCAVDASRVYIASHDDGIVRSFDKSAGGSEITHAIGGAPLAVAVDGSHVYWSDTTGAIRRAPKGGGAAETLATGLATPGSIAVNSRAIYWVSGPGSVMMLPKP